MNKPTFIVEEMHYESAGVESIDKNQGFRSLLADLKTTFSLRKDGSGNPILGFGQFANILDIGGEIAIAISTDGVGTKALIAQAVDRYDTIGIDCVAMNANDVICVGAEPIAMTDYIAVDAATPRLFAELGKGLLEGARQAGISIPGGEIAQIPSIIKGEREGYSFDLVGTCVGTVRRDRIITGSQVEHGDAIVGISSSGVHSNGLSLARKALLHSNDFELDHHVPELGCTLGEELLRPTKIYVQPVLQMLEEQLEIKALTHITSDGFLNLQRVDSNVGFDIEWLPTPPAIFGLIQNYGQISAGEMYRVFNMGVGFCVIASDSSADRVVEIAGEHGHDAWKIGRCSEDKRRIVHLRSVGLRGHDGSFEPV